jgi:hypothetical protein
VPKLTGKITVHGGAKPASTAVVELHNSSGDVIDQVMVDDEGRYIYHLVAGRWHLRVWDAHGHRGETEVELDASEDTECDLDLEEPVGGHG